MHSQAHCARVPYESNITAITRAPPFHYRRSRDSSRKISFARLRVKGTFSPGDVSERHGNDEQRGKISDEYVQGEVFVLRNIIV